MDVKSYMATELITVTPQTTVMQALDLMKAHGIRRLPVVVGEKQLVGLLTEELIAHHSPSTATSLSVHELNYLLNKTTAQDIMIKNVVTVQQDTFLEEAAILMRTRNVGVLPVVEDNNTLVGIITDKDIFDAFVDILGYRTPGTRLVVEMEDEPGVFEEITRTLKEQDWNIGQIAVYHQDEKALVVIHVESGRVDDIADSIAQKGFRIVSAVKKNI